MRILTIVAVGWICLLAGCSQAASATTAPTAAADKYYIVVFAAQAGPNRPRSSHTFATFVKESAAAGAGKAAPAETHTISWLPANGNIVIVRLAPEPGKNFTLAETMKWAKQLNARVTAWGPFEVKQVLYDSALKQIDRLNSGAVAYKAVDSLFRGSAVNCVHAVSDIALEDGLLQQGTAFGEAASAMVVRHLQPWMVNPEATHPHIAKQLGLKKGDVKFQKTSKAERSAP